MTANIAVCFVGSEQVATDHHLSIVGEFVQDAATTRRLYGLLYQEGHVNVATPRNECAKLFLASPAQWAVWVDADIIPSPGDLVRLVERAEDADLPILGATCFYTDRGAGMVRAAPTVYRHGPDGTFIPDVATTLTAIREHQIVPTPVTGMGCVAIRRDVFENISTLGRNYWFREVWTDRGEPVGEDFWFFQQAAALGYPTHVDGSIVTAHQQTACLTPAMFQAQNEQWTSRRYVPNSLPR